METDNYFSRFQRRWESYQERLKSAREMGSDLEEKSTKDEIYETIFDAIIYSRKLREFTAKEAQSLHPETPFNTRVQLGAFSFKLEMFENKLHAQAKSLIEEATRW